MKFKLNQTIHYLLENRPHSAPVMSRMTVDNAHDDWASTDEQKEAFTPFGESRVVYGTCHGLIEEQDAFESKRALAEFIAGEE